MNSTAARLLALPLTLAALAATPPAASAEQSAQQPTPQQAEIAQAIAAPPAAVWAVIGSFQDMGWHPAVTKTEGTGGNDPGATRTLTLTGGGQIVETLASYDPASRNYTYRITRVDPKVLPVANYSSRLSVAPAPAGGSVVTWQGTFERASADTAPPPELSDAAAVKAVTGVYQGGLTNLKSRLEQPGK